MNDVDMLIELLEIIKETPFESLHESVYKATVRNAFRNVHPGITSQEIAPLLNKLCSDFNILPDDPSTPHTDDTSTPHMDEESNDPSTSHTDDSSPSESTVKRMLTVRPAPTQEEIVKEYSDKIFDSIQQYLERCKNGSDLHEWLDLTEQVKSALNDGTVEIFTHKIEDQLRDCIENLDDIHDLEAIVEMIKSHLESLSG